jgi:ABC-type uncharacterized transport system substrate-binding protein
VAAWPLAARAQQPALPVIGWLSSASPDGYGHVVHPFREGLNEVGYTEGQNVAFEYRWARDQNDRLPALAEDLVRSRVAVIVAAGGTQTALAAKAATTTIPIVFVNGSDPVKFGLVASLNRPGGNVTGMTLITVQLMEKRLEFARELVPGGAVVGLLVNSANPNAEAVIQDAQAAGQALGRRVLVFEVGHANDLYATFSAIVQKQVGALVVTADPIFTNHRDQLIALATRHAIPAIYANRDLAKSGGLMSYGTNVAEAYRVIGKYAGRILGGARPADLPVLQPTKFELVINLKAAKIIGLDVPPMLLALADEVIE